MIHKEFYIGFWDILGFLLSSFPELLGLQLPYYPPLSYIVGKSFLL